MDDEIQGEAVELGGLKPLTLSVSTIPGTLMRNKTCSACHFGVKEKGDLVCRFNPPQASFIPVPQEAVVPTPHGPRRQMVMMVKNHSGFPLVHPDQWCGKWEATRK